MYKPSDDTFLLADYVRSFKGKYALDICTGSGYIARVLSKGFEYVIATDIDLDSLMYAKHISDVEFVCCYGASAINGIKFDLITMNPPYLPSNDIKDRAVDGGYKGVEVTLNIVKDCLRLMDDNTRFIIVSSSLADIDHMLKELKALRLNAEIVKSKRIGFEDIMLIQLRRV